MLCPKCKTEVVSEAVFCHECGSKLYSDESGIKQALHPNLIDNTGSIDRPFFIASIIAGLIVFLASAVWAFSILVTSPSYTIILFIITLFAFIYLVFTASLFVYKMWSLIQNGLVRTTPHKAVGFLFIPFFNLYWAFQAIWGFSKDYNQYVKANFPDAPELQENLFLGLSILFALTAVLLFVPPLTIYVLTAAMLGFLYLIYITSKAVDALADSAELSPAAGDLESKGGENKIKGYLNSLKNDYARLGGLIFGVIVLVAFLITAILPRGHFIVGNVVIPEEVVYGDNIIVSLDTENVGGGSGTYDLTIFIDEQAVQSESVYIESGTGEKVEFNIRDDYEPGIYQISLGLGSFNVIPEEYIKHLKVLTPAEFEISNLQLNPPQIDHMEQTKVTVDISNIGEAEGTLNLELKIDGSAEEQKEFKLKGETTTKAEFNLVMENPGRYAIAVNGLSEMLDVYKIERPDNGAVLINEISGGHGVMRIDNHRDLDSVVVLSRSNEPDKPVLAVYVQAEDSTTVRRIRDGTYTVYYSHGLDWDSHSKRFTRYAEHGRYENEARFTTTHTDTGYTYWIWEYEFGVFDLDEPAATRNVAPDDFPSMM